MQSLKNREKKNVSTRFYERKYFSRKHSIFTLVNHFEVSFFDVSTIHLRFTQKKIL